MYGPCPAGHWSAAYLRNPPSHGPLRRGERYEVVRAFRDFDGFEHAVGERWTFLGANYQPYDDGVSLFVSLDDVGEWHIRMRDFPGDQAEVLAALDAHVARVGP